MSFIKTEIQSHIATVTLNRPELHNAFNDDMIRDLTRTFQDLGKNSAIRVIILAGEGKSFCAGADLNWMKSMLDYSFDQNVDDARALATMLQTIAECPKPVIGRVHGAAFGGGVGLASVCDLVVALESVSFSLSEVKLGLLPAVISPFVLRKIPVSQAQRYFLTAERFKAQDAFRLGLVSEVVLDTTDMDVMIHKWIDTLCQNGPEAVGLCKQLIRDVSASPSLADAMTLSTRMIAERRVSTEGQEGMQAFLEKRPADWIPAELKTHVS